MIVGCDDKSILGVEDNRNLIVRHETAPIIPGVTAINRHQLISFGTHRNPAERSPANIPGRVSVNYILRRRRIQFTSDQKIFPSRHEIEFHGCIHLIRRRIVSYPSHGDNFVAILQLRMQIRNHGAVDGFSKDHHTVFTPFDADHLFPHSHRTVFAIIKI